VARRWSVESDDELAEGPGGEVGQCLRRLIEAAGLLDDDLGCAASLVCGRPVASSVVGLAKIATTVP
jgi:hypothetical protein